MPKTTSPEGGKISGFFCQLFGHRYVISKQVTSHVKEYRCAHCHKEVTTSAEGKLATLTERLKNVNETLHNMYVKRNRRLAPIKQPKRRVA